MLNDLNYAMLAMSIQQSFHEAHLKHKIPTARRDIRVALEALFFGVIKIIKPPVIVEIGAHGAEFSIRCKTELPASRVVAFEANPTVWGDKKAAVSAAGVEFLNMAVADKSGKLSFSVPLRAKDKREFATMGSLVTGPANVEHKTYDVAAARIDTFLGDDVARPNVLWIDVEGGVKSVLGGAHATLASCQALYVELEPTDERWPGQMIDKEVFKVLNAAGLVPVLRDVQRQGWQYNCVFMRPALAMNPRIKALYDSYFASLFAASAPVSAPAAVPSTT